MADFCDIASDVSQQMLDDALAARRRIAATPTVDRPYCVDCGTAIPLRRREFLPGVETCVDCSAIREHVKQGVRRG